MGEPALARMSVEEFFAWQSAQDGLYELVDGLPVPHVKMVTGASAQHDRATVNLIVTLHAQLHGIGCRPTTDDVGLRTGIRTLRRPDMTVECGELVRDIYENGTPRLVVEVLSPSTSSIDRFRKLDEYRRHPSLAYILLIETRFPSAVLYRRTDETPGSDTGADIWESETYERLDAVIELPAIAARLALADLYEDVAFELGRPLPA